MKFNILKIFVIKISLIFSIFFFSTNLNARTVGSFIGIDLLKTDLSCVLIRAIYLQQDMTLEQRKQLRKDLENQKMDTAAQPAPAVEMKEDLTQPVTPLPPQTPVV